MRSVGLEEEFLLVDAESGMPRAVAAAVLRQHDEEEASGAAVGSRVDAELKQEMIEADTRPHTDMAELMAEVVALRERLDGLAQRSGARLAALATSPLNAPPTITPSPRYQAISAQFGLLEHEQLTCGCHVHVSVESAEEAVAVLDRIRAWLPVITAVSANSPFWRGVRTGYASYRTQVWGRWPSAGPLEVLGTAEAYRSMVGSLVESGVLLDEAMVYFDARISARYPTVEIRVADVCLYAVDAGLVATLARALVDTAARAWREGSPPLDVPTPLLRAAQWRASRSGVTGDLVNPHSGRPDPAEVVVERLLEHVSAALDETGDLDGAKRGLETVLRRGNGAVRQLAAWTDAHRLDQVVAAAVSATHATDEPRQG